MDFHNQVAGIINRNICAEFEMEASESKMEIPPRVVENIRVKMLWDFQIQTDEQVMANQPNM